MPTRRTLIVFVALIGSMTAVSALLLLFQPATVQTRKVPRLSATQETTTASQAIFRTDQTLQRQRWQSIVISYSNQRSGTADTLDADHRRLGYGSLGYHFVIDNGRGGPDGRVEIGPRWVQQEGGAHTTGPDADWYNQHAIGICLIGEGKIDQPTDEQLRSLIWLVQQLQMKLGIPAQHVLLPLDHGRVFPVAWFREQLLTPAAP